MSSGDCKNHDRFMSRKTGILQRLFNVLKGGAGAENDRDTAGLHIELAQRNEEIARLRKEYALQREQSRAQCLRAEGDAIEGIVRQCAAPLAAFSAMQARHREHGDLNPSDLFQVASSFQNILAERGLEQISVVGEQQPYDPAFHQMLDGTTPQVGELVQIRFVGFRFNGKLIAKAQAGAVQVKT
ncbi:hypothetical protein Paes_1324 [Prosthecochloris aestuarii DSM 271]|uniref:Nucleotide exchange factor GrpE n=1 Tax=Prosthecochloris aestuarii (strain DSM 271 / SK 413) TaxID=290512 RepID=B4S8G2_PROA2|nr:nucleotide exchange factor GrpE [Prosthecochloris aestuarii]ACF46349.1 hypothetical protein Paes_1324 [Prosthecochloris aestuarii DSM 271]